MIRFLEKLLLDKDEDPEIYEYYYGDEGEGKYNKISWSDKDIAEYAGDGGGESTKQILIGGFYDILYGSNDNSDSDGGGSVKVESESYTRADVCSPGKVGTFKKDGTCFTTEALQEIAGAINKTPDMKKIKDIKGKSKKELWNDIKEQMKGCNNEWCWLSKSFVKNY